MGREVHFTKRLPDNRWLSIIIGMEDHEGFDDALACLAATRDDWAEFGWYDNAATDWCEIDIDTGARRRARPLTIVGKVVKEWDEPSLTRTPPRPPIPGGYSDRNERYGHDIAVEPNIPHNWVTGVGDLLDHLDWRTRALARQAIALADDAIEDGLMDGCGWLEGTAIPVRGKPPHIRMRHAA
jgi:hypothetical protein